MKNESAKEIAQRKSNPDVAVPPDMERPEDRAELEKAAKPRKANEDQPNGMTPSKGKAVPPYPCVELRAITRHVSRNSNSSVNDEAVDERLFVPIRGIGDVEHVEQMRKHKGMAIIAAHNLEKLKKSKEEEVEGDSADKITRELKALINPPEKKFRELDERAGE